MSKFRVSWIESRVHYVEVEAENEFEALEKAENFTYDETASDESFYNNHAVMLLGHPDRHTNGQTTLQL